MIRKKEILPETRFLKSGAATTLLLALAVCFTVGCAVPPGESPVPREPPPPPRDVLERLFGAPPEEGIQATVKVSLEVPEGKYFKSAALVMKYPDSLRIEALPLMGTPDLFLTANVRLLKAYFPEENLFLVGEPTAPNLYALFRLYLAVPDVVSLLMGHPPGLKDPRQRYTARWEGPLYRVDVFLGEKIIQTLWIDLEKGKLTRCERVAWNGHPALQILFRDAVSITGGGELPGGLSIAFGEPVSLLATIRVKGPERAHTLPENVFDLLPPEGATLRWIEGGGPEASPEAETN
ncbi:MAG TPA: hypothetical protein PKL99_04535 [Syntrophales bacterium]|nr:hypothetical protein [Syntrophales bacterium]